MQQTENPLQRLENYYREHTESILKDYFTFLKFKSISTEPEFHGEMSKCVNWLEEFLTNTGFETEIWHTTGYPVLFAQDLTAGADKPTLLIYNHYDVQPVDPVELWDTPPFEPTIKEKKVYARGAQDNKGQCMYALEAVKALKHCFGRLPVNIKWVIEGEEEAGSKGLGLILEKKRKELQADYLVVCDVGIPAEEIPAVTLGVRGIITMDINLTGSKCDLHSGTHGGRAYNPLNALVEILAKLRDEEGKILVPGFYDDVVELSPEERKLISFDFNAVDYENTFGIIATGGEKNYPPLERSTIRPTIDINGICGGYTGSGFKTVIPAHANVKLSSRLVPNQNPFKIAKAIENYLMQHVPKGITMKIDIHKGGGEAIRADSRSAIAQAFTKAYSEVFNAPCGFSFEGGSIPVISHLKQVSGAEVVLVGVGLDSDQIHAPNEHFGLERFRKGFLVMARAIQNL